MLAHLASLVAQMVKNLPAMQETQVQILGQEDPLEKGMVTHSSILAIRMYASSEHQPFIYFFSFFFFTSVPSSLRIVPDILCVCECTIVSDSL